MPSFALEGELTRQSDSRLPLTTFLSNPDLVDRPMAQSVAAEVEHKGVSFARVEPEGAAKGAFRPLMRKGVEAPMGLAVMTIFLATATHLSVLATVLFLARGERHGVILAAAQRSKRPRIAA